MRGEWSPEVGRGESKHPSLPLARAERKPLDLKKKHSPRHQRANLLKENPALLQQRSDPRATSARTYLKKKQPYCNGNLPRTHPPKSKNPVINRCPIEERMPIIMEKNIAVIWGDCSSPEIVKQTLRVLDKVAEKYGHTFHYTDAAMGGEAIDKYGDPLPQHELDKCLAADSVLLGAVGGPKWEGLPGEQRPEKGLLRLRAGMGLYSNNRPAKIWPQLAPASPLKPEIVAKGIDFIIVRELIGGVYFGKHETYTLENGEKQAVDSMPYSEHEIERIGRIGFETAMKRRKKLCCVDKANVLDTSRLWRAVMHRLQAEYPEVEYSEMFVDNCAMQVVKDPSQFDVIVTENMFGDIISDEASMITGSIGMIPSSSLGDGTRGLYEPIHGSAPDIAGKDIVNPTACILSAAMMLRYSFGMTEEADAIESAVNKVLDKGLRTADNMSEGCTCLGCTAMGDAILAEI